MNKDKYGEIINGTGTYCLIADNLMRFGQCVIGWTDEKYDHRDILFTYNASLRHYGNLHGGRHNCKLYVSIIGVSCNAFLILDGDRDNTKHDTYIKEKLNLNDNSCDDKICELINGVIREIDKVREL